MKQILIFWVFVIGCSIYGQTNSISIKAILNPVDKEIYITQSTTYINTSKDTLSEIFFHNWANAYKSKNTPLAKRFTESYKKSFHFAKEKHRGHTKINSVTADKIAAKWNSTPKNPDILKVTLPNKLPPSKSVTIKSVYTVKLPKSKFTGYGYNDNSYYLKYWYLSPAIYQKKWKTYSNLDLNDLYASYSNYNIEFTVPKSYTVISDLISASKIQQNKKTYFLIGNNRNEIVLIVNPVTKFSLFKAGNSSVYTNILNNKLSQQEKDSILKKSISFLEEYLGKDLQKKIILSETEYYKSPVYGFNQLPSFLAPFEANFEFDIKTFKILTKKIIDSKLLVNKREDTWLSNGLQIYLMLKYVDKYYPETKAIGKIANLWGIRKFYISKVAFNQKYLYVNQFAARKNIDQPLITKTDSLSNFNQKIASKYKAGIGLNYLDLYLNTLDFKQFIKNFLASYKNVPVTSQMFINSIEKRTTKNIDWFKNGFLKTTKRIDYTINKIIPVKDSLKVVIHNKGTLNAPTLLYGIADKKIITKKWLLLNKTTDTITIEKKNLDKLSLNYEGNLPEFNLKNNWKNIEKKWFNRPLSIKIFNDIEDPYHNQLFVTPILRYNYYDGFILGAALSNKTILKKNFVYRIIPSFGTKSKNLSGSYSFYYQHMPKNRKFKSLTFGAIGNHFDYDKQLSYHAIQPFITLEFNKKNFRSVASKAIALSYTMVDKEYATSQKLHPESNNYKVLSIGFGYSNPAIIKDIRFNSNFQVSSKFSKASITARYRKLTHTNSQLDFRFFTGVFLNNKTQSNYFNFALDRPSDYLFQNQYLGRSETSGFFSQQIIINEGGFKSKFPTAYANQWISTFNTSVGLWKWIEIYNDFGILKNKNKKAYFAYENGVHLNFIQDVLELYFPIYTSNGWEITKKKYPQKIRFVLTIRPQKIISFLKRGFY